ncbi:MAG: rod shape-determining protein MreC [Candidatus Omnitrophota bacterium]
MLFPKRKLISLLALVVFILFVVFLSLRSSTYASRSLALDLFRLPLSSCNGLVHEIRALFLFHKNYWKNLELERENAELRARGFDYEKISVENERYRKLLGFKKNLLYETVSAKVIGKDFSPFRPFLILDRGRFHGVRKYAPVFTYAGLVGKVLEVGQYSSKVILINVCDLSVPACNARTREQGLVSGTLDGRCKLRFLDLDSDVKEGDLIVTSGLNMVYPEGIIIGTVRIVGVESSGLGKFAVLEPSVNVSRLDEVLVVKTIAK